MSKANPMRRYTLFLPEKMIERLESAADSGETSVSDIIRTAVDAELANRQRKSWERTYTAADVLSMLAEAMGADLQDVAVGSTESR